MGIGPTKKDPKAQPRSQLQAIHLTSAVRSFPTRADLLPETLVPHSLRWALRAAALTS